MVMGLCKVGLCPGLGSRSMNILFLSVGGRMGKNKLKLNLKLTGCTGEWRSEGEMGKEAVQLWESKMFGSGWLG